FDLHGRYLSVGGGDGCNLYDVRHIKTRAKRAFACKQRQSRVEVRCFSAASRSASESRASSTARASVNAPTIVATVTRACSCAPFCPQSGDWRATRSIISLMRRVATRRTAGAWRDISEPSAAVAQPLSALWTCALDR